MRFPWSKSKNEEIEEFIDNFLKEEVEEETLNEEWIWVEGFKGMDGNMRCKNSMQYEIGGKYSYEGVVKLCKSGLHFSLTLKDAESFYKFTIDEGKNRARFFRVKGLVRKSDFENYSDKLAAKELEVISEIAREEYFELAKTFCFMNTLEDFELCDKIGYYPAAREIYKNTLVNKGFSETFAMATAEKWCTNGNGTRSLKDKMNLMIGMRDEGVSTDMLVYLMLK